MALAKSELATYLGHGGDDLEHKLRLRARLVHFYNYCGPVWLPLLIPFNFKDPPLNHKDALFSRMTSTPPC